MGGKLKTVVQALAIGRLLKREVRSLARDLGTQVVAEGVETAEQFGFLREVGCAAAQGFYFSPPVDSAGARSLLERTGSW